MRILFWIGALIVGSCLGAVTFPMAYALVERHSPYNPRPNFQSRILQEYLYMGTVEQFDGSRRFMTIRPIGKFTAGTSTPSIRFTYDEETEWLSVEYSIRDNAIEERKSYKEKPFSELPEGTLVAIYRDPDSSVPWRIESIVLMRRTLL